MDIIQRSVKWNSKWMLSVTSKKKLRHTHTHTFTHLWSVDYYHAVTQNGGLLPVSCCLILSQESTANGGGVGLYSFTTMATYILSPLWHFNKNFILAAVSCWLTDKQNKKLLFWLSWVSSGVEKPFYLLIIFHTSGEKGIVLQHQLNPVRDIVAENISSQKPDIAQRGKFFLMLIRGLVLF